MSQQKYNVLKFAALAVAVATAGGCVSAKTNPGDEQAMAAPAPTTMVAAPAAMNDGDTSYTVASGDNLWDISNMEQIYATPYKWPLILKANSGQITDADLIFPGQEFAIPRGTSASEDDAAIMHAKTRGAWSVGDVEATDTAYLGG